MKSGDYDHDILDMSTDLSIGDRSEHLVCPACNGGDGNERSLLVWCNPEGLSYKCYRAKCSLSGRVGQMGYRPTTSKIRKPKCHVRDLDAEPLPDDVLDWLLDYFWWMTEDMLMINGVMWSETKECVLYPIKAMTGKHEGYLIRRYDELVLRRANMKGPKAKAYYNSLPDDYRLTCMMTPHMAQFEDYVAVFEDFPSALRCNEYLPSCALSGTSIQESTLMELVRAGKRHVCLVLDADATAKAAKMAYTYGLHFHSLTFVPLYDVDPKDMSDDAMDELVETIKTQLRID